MTETRPTRWIDLAWSALGLSTLLASLVFVADRLHLYYVATAAPYLHPVFFTSLAYRSSQDPFVFMIECAFFAWTAIFSILLGIQRALGLKLLRSVLIAAGLYVAYASVDSFYWQHTFEAVEQCKEHGGVWDWKLGVCGEKRP